MSTSRAETCSTSYKFFLPFQEQVSLTSHRQESQSYLPQKGSERVEPAKESSPERVTSTLTSETVCLSSKMLQWIWHLKECIFCNSRQRFLKRAYTYPGTDHPLASQNSPTTACLCVDPREQREIRTALFCPVAKTLKGAHMHNLSQCCSLQ